MESFASEKGLKILNNFTGVSLEGTEKVEGFVLTNGNLLKADMVVYGIGSENNSEFLKDHLKNQKNKSVEVNGFLQTKNKDIYSCGDVASFPLSNGSLVNVSHYSDAITQGTFAAWNMLEKNITYHTVPFFWTRFFNKSFAFTGFHREFDDVVLKGDLKENKFLAIYCKDKECFSASGAGRSHDIVIINQALRLGLKLNKEDVQKESFVSNLKKEILKNSSGCACERKENMEK